MTKYTVLENRYNNLLLWDTVYHINVNVCSGMMGYGMAKAAVHQLVKSLGEQGSGLPDGTCALGILPVTLDTPMNRLVDKDQV